MIRQNFLAPAGYALGCRSGTLDTNA